MLSNQQRAYGYAAGAVLLWSTVATAFKLSLQWLSVPQLLFIATLSSTGILLLILALRGQPAAPFRLLRQQPLRFAALGALNPFLYYLILFAAYDRLPAQVAQPLNYTWAIALALLSVPLLGQRLTRRDLVACLLGYSGVVVIASGGSLSGFSGVSSTGVALALISTLLWALYWLLNTRQQSEPVASLTAGFLCAVPLVTLAVAVEGNWSFPWQGIAGALYVGLFEMGVTFVLWLQALRLTESTARVSNLIFLSPFLSLLLISRILGEQVVPATWAGLVLIIAGVWYQQHKSGQ